MPLFSMKFDAKKLNLVRDWVGKFDEVASQPEVMDVGVKHLGREIRRIFENEGNTSNWQGLSIVTKEIRESRGYGRAHPIMVQSGALKDLTAGSMTAWGIGTGRFTGNDGEGTRMSAWTGQKAFTAKISGPKVVNHYGGINEESRYGSRADNPQNPGRIPARPFFMLTRYGVDMAELDIISKIMTDWARRSGTAKVVKR